MLRGVLYGPRTPSSRGCASRARALWRGLNAGDCQRSLVQLLHEPLGTAGDGLVIEPPLVVAGNPAAYSLPEAVDCLPC